jgi:archaellum component FlaC
MSEILKNKVGDLQAGQETLLTKQSQNLQVSDSLLSAFNKSIEKMNGLSSGVTETINKLNQAQSELERVISTFRNISQDVNASSSKFGESQLTFSKYSNEFLQNNSNTIEEIQKSLTTAKEVSTDYARKFEIIEKGLQQIFAQIKDGLEQYQNAVRNNLQTILGEYTKSLTKSAESLASATELQSESIKDLAEEINRLKG